MIGGVVYSSNEVVASGVIRNSTPARNRLILGKPDGERDTVLETLVDLLRRAGYEAEATNAIRQALWTKILIVVGATLDRLALDDEALTLMTALTREGTAIGRRLGFVMPDDIGPQLAHYRDNRCALRCFRTSTSAANPSSTAASWRSPRLRPRRGAGAGHGRRGNVAAHEGGRNGVTRLAVMPVVTIRRAREPRDRP